jgi:uncharacterized protein (TIGR02646 family)
MIALEKTQCPTILQNNADAWTTEILRLVSSGLDAKDRRRTRYAHEDIKSAILSETFGKCAYCESKVRHISYGDIEHIIPKKIDPTKWFEWTNLTLACDICNTWKGEFPVTDTNFVDPYSTDPESHFIFLGASLFPMPGDDAAKSAEVLLTLNRPPLMEKREEKIKSVLRQFEIIAKTPGIIVKQSLADHLSKELMKESEFSAVGRFLFRALLSQAHHPAMSEALELVATCLQRAGVHIRGIGFTSPTPPPPTPPGSPTPPAAA